MLLVVFYLAWPLTADGVSATAYPFLFLAFFNSFFLLRVFMHWTVLFLVLLCFSSTFLYYSSEMEVPITAFIWGFAFFFSWRPILSGAGELTVQIFTIGAATLLTFCCGLLVKAIATKWIIGTYRRLYWWERIKQSLNKEEVLEALIKGPYPNWRALHSEGFSSSFHLT